MEIVRLQNAKVLRSRIDELQAIDPQIDISGRRPKFPLQSAQVYKNMQKTGVNDILFSDSKATWLKRHPCFTTYGTVTFRAKRFHYERRMGNAYAYPFVQRLVWRSGVQYAWIVFKLFTSDFNIYPDSPRWKWSNDFNGYGVSDRCPSWQNSQPVGIFRNLANAIMTRPLDFQP